MAGRLPALSCVLCIGYLMVGVAAQDAPPQPDRAAAEAMAKRVAERVRALEREAARLAGESRTLLGDLRRLEIERDLAVERVRTADNDVAAAQRDLQSVWMRYSALEHKRVAALPDLSARFIELYKHGPGSYARMLAGVRDLKEFGRATRAVASMAEINRQRIAEHRRTLDALKTERAALEQKTRDVQARRTAAQRARGAADRALVARSALLAQIDSRRDLNAQLAGELMVAQQKLQAAIVAMRAGQQPEPVAVPLAPFRGVLDWPVSGRVTADFGDYNRASGTGVRNGIDVAAAEGAFVRAIHPGTVSYADSFTGYGTLAIVDHGADQYSLYGYLSSLAVARGDRVQAGQELGRVGLAPSGPAALYFELRVDGRSVDPIQWLKRR